MWGVWFESRKDSYSYRFWFGPRSLEKGCFDELGYRERFPNVHSLNLGGGYKVARMPDENATDLKQEIGEPVKNLFINFARETGRKLKVGDRARHIPTCPCM